MCASMGQVAAVKEIAQSVGRDGCLNDEEVTGKTGIERMRVE